MKNLGGKAAVVTGAASGIGLGIARALARAGVDVALCDVEEEPLARARATLSEMNVRTVAIPLDVADRTAVYDAAETVREAFGRLHILCNNAGVGYSGTPLDRIPDDDYDWVIGVNLFGAIHGVKAFTPLILETGEGGHIVNTASISGLRISPGWTHGLYGTAKFGIVGFSEYLADDLGDRGIGVSVLCPEAVKTNIYQAGRNRPDRYGGPFEKDTDHPLVSHAEGGLSADDVGEMVRWAIETDRFYILTHPHTRAQVEARHERMMADYDATDAYYAARGKD